MNSIKSFESKLTENISCLGTLRHYADRLWHSGAGVREKQNLPGVLLSNVPGHDRVRHAARTAVPAGTAEPDRTAAGQEPGASAPNEDGRTKSADARQPGLRGLELDRNQWIPDIGRSPSLERLFLIFICIPNGFGNENHLKQVV